MTMNEPVARAEMIARLRSELEPVGAAHEAGWIADHCEGDLSRALAVAARRRTGEPLAYILGSWAFRGFEFFVGPGVLIPRPETEEVIEAVIQASGAELLFHARAGRPIRVADFGAGSGCMGLSMMAELVQMLEKRKIAAPQLRLDLIESSEKALPWLEKNIEAMAPQMAGVEARILRSDWKSARIEAFDIGLANPPYVSEDEYALCDKSVRDYEPRSALVPSDIGRFGDASGPYRELFGIAKERLNPGGWLWCEIGPSQVEWIGDFARGLDVFDDVRMLRDMSGKKRIVGVHKDG